MATASILTANLKFGGLIGFKKTCGAIISLGTQEIHDPVTNGV